MYGVLSVFQYKKVPSKRETAQLGVDITPQMELSFFNQKSYQYPTATAMSWHLETQETSEKIQKTSWIFGILSVEPEQRYQPICHLKLRLIWLNKSHTWYPKQPFFNECLVKQPIFYVMIWNHPIEPTIKNWFFGVPGKNEAEAPKPRSYSDLSVATVVESPQGLPRKKKQRTAWHHGG